MAKKTRVPAEPPADRPEGLPFEQNAKLAKPLLDFRLRCDEALNEMLVEMLAEVLATNAIRFTTTGNRPCVLVLGLGEDAVEDITSKLKLDL